MRLGRIYILMVCFALLSSFVYAEGNSAYKVSPQVPLESWTYPALDKIVALCQVKTGLAGTRPLTRLEAARLITEASRNATFYYVPPQAKVLLARLMTEFRDELTYLAAEQSTTAEVPSRLLRSAELRYTHQDGKKTVYPGTDARQFSLNYNNSGRDYDNHNNGEFSLLGEVRLFDSLLLTWQPLVSQRESDTKVTTLSAVAAIAYEGVELSVGRQALWWGPGRHGSLILTNNAKPLDMIRLTNQSPLQLPWLFKYLGPFRFDTFISRLDNNRVVDEPYFGGLRLNFKPSQYLELGASRTVMFGGDGRASVDASDFLTILGGNNLSGNEDTSNSLAGVDARLNFPLLWGMELYGELVGEDEAGGFFSRNSYMVGTYLPQIEPTGTLSLRVEYADTTRIGGGGSVLYRHGIYQSGYIYEGQIMGHHVGSDSTDLSVGLDIDCSERLALSLGFDFEERGLSLAVQEKHTQVELKGTWWMNSDLAVSAHYAYDSVENWNFVEGDQDFYMTSLGVEYSF